MTSNDETARIKESKNKNSFQKNTTDSVNKINDPNVL